MSVKDIFRAMNLSKENAALAEDITNRSKKVERDAKRLDKKYLKDLETSWDDALVPFAQLFGRIKNCDLSPVELSAGVPKAARIDVETQKASIDAFDGLVALASGAGVGLASSTATFAAVATFATASTGTAIGSLSGAAATSATLAWLGGGSLATGGLGVAGGTAVVAGVIAIPIFLVGGWFLSNAGSKELKKQKKQSAELTILENELLAAEEFMAKLDAAAAKSRLAIIKLRKMLIRLNATLEATLDVHDDYRQFTDREKHRLGTQMNLSIALITLISTPLVVESKNKAGAVTSKVNPAVNKQVKAANALIDASNGQGK